MWYEHQIKTGQEKGVQEGEYPWNQARASSGNRASCVLVRVHMHDVWLVLRVGG
jgi:hypothetical protein